MRLRPKLAAFAAPHSRGPGRAPSRAATRDDEAALARRAARGDRTAVRSIYDTHIGAMRRHLSLLLGGDPDLDDAVQTTFMRAFQSIGRFRGDCSLSTWLHRIAINEARQILRARMRRERREDAAGQRIEGNETPTPERRLAAREEAMGLLRGLPPREREAFVLCQYEELTLEEAAGLVGVPSTTLSSRLQRARQRLASALRSLRKRIEQTDPEGGPTEGQGGGT